METWIQRLSLGDGERGKCGAGEWPAPTTRWRMLHRRGLLDQRRRLHLRGLHLDVDLSGLWLGPWRHRKPDLEDAVHEDSRCRLGDRPFGKRDRAVKLSVEALCFDVLLFRRFERLVTRTLQNETLVLHFHRHVLRLDTW